MTKGKKGKHKNRWPSFNKKEKVERTCLKCNRKFMSVNDRTCKGCQESNQGFGPMAEGQY
jgi:hypothetical protein